MFDQSRGGERVWFKARIYTQRIAVHKTCREAHLLRLHNPGSHTASVEVLFDRLYIQSDNSLRRKIKWLKKNTRKILRTVFFMNAKYTYSRAHSDVIEGKTICSVVVELSRIFVVCFCIFISFREIKETWEEINMECWGAYILWMPLSEGQLLIDLSCSVLSSPSPQNYSF